MRMRLGMLHDPEAQQRMHDREQKAAEEKKRKEETPTVRSELEQQKHDEQKAKDAQDKGDGKKADEKAHKVKIRPLSEARAIELGANFFSEAFIFAVAAGLLVWDSWRSRRKESQRRDDVADRLLQLETEVESLRAQLDPDLETLHDLSERIKQARSAKQSTWWNPASWGRTAEDTAIMEESHDMGKLRKLEEEEHITPIRKAKAKATTEKTDESGQVKEDTKQTLKPAVDAIAAGADKKTDDKATTKVDSGSATTKGR